MQLVYEYLRELAHDTTVTYEQLDKVLGRDSRIDRGPIKAAMRKLEKNDKRTLINVRGVGYRIAQPAEHADVAMRRVEKSRRVMRSAASCAKAADRSQLTPEESAKLDTVAIQVGGLVDAMDEVRRKQKKFQDDLVSLREENKQDRRNNATQMAAMEERVDQLTKRVAELDGGVVPPEFSAPLRPQQTHRVPESLPLPTAFAPPPTPAGAG
jgi:hypothetical protein